MYTVLGATGQIGSQIAKTLLAGKHPVRVVGRDADRLEALTGLGALARVGDIADAAFLTSALRGSTAVYVMLPPCYGAQDPLQAYRRMAEAIAMAVAAAGVQRIVNLSSIGAHLPSGTGPIVSLHQQEQRLNALSGVSVLHLRPGAFYENHFNAIGVIRQAGIYCDMISPQTSVPCIATQDVAEVAARELTSPTYQTGRHVLHLHGPRAHTPVEAARILGASIGMHGLQYVQGDPGQVKAGMVQHGLSPAMADLFEEMCGAFDNPAFGSRLQVEPALVTSTTLEQFAPRFAAAYGVRVPAVAT